MANDAEKAHEYYVKYRKKGLKKGRKKGKAKTYSLLGTGRGAELNDEGKIQAALIKERLKKEMNAALAGAKTDAEREKIRAEYSRKAQQEINALKSKYGKEKKAKVQKEKSSGKSGGKSNGSGEGKSEKAPKSSSGSSSNKAKQNAKVNDAAKRVLNSINRLQKTLKSMPPEMRAQKAAYIQNALSEMRRLYGQLTKKRA